jgi:hypothetical protein
VAKPRYRFVNLDGSGPHEIAAVFKWAVIARVLGRRRPAPSGAGTPQLAPNIVVSRSPPAPIQGARLTWNGHASWLVQLDGVSLLIDPVFSEHLGPGIRLLRAHLPLG